MAAKSTSASQPEASQNGKKNVKEEKPVANKQDADDEAEDEPVEKGAKGEAVKDMRNVTRYFEEQAERSVDADKIQKVRARFFTVFPLIQLRNIDSMPSSLPFHFLLLGSQDSAGRSHSPQGRYCVCIPKFDYLN
jgi:hypothetical protein